MVGNGARVTFSSNTPGTPLAGMGTVEEGTFVNGRWVPGRLLAGDDTEQGDYSVPAEYGHPARDGVPLPLTQEAPPMIHDPSRLASVLHALNLSAALSFASAALAGAEPAPSPREIIPLDNGWRFHLGDDPAACRPDFDDTSWRTLDVPHDWSIEGPVNPPPEGEGNGGYFSHGIGWYRKSFTLPPTAGKKVVIEFDGVYMNSEVWINGQLLGRRPYGFIGFRYDLTQFLKTERLPQPPGRSRG